jgi:hypothetical protein
MAVDEYLAGFQEVSHIKRALGVAGPDRGGRAVLGPVGPPDERCDDVELGPVVERPERDRGIQAAAEYELVHRTADRLGCFPVAGRRDVDALDRPADLAGGDKGCGEQSRKRGIQVDVVQQYRGVVAAELERQALQVDGGSRVDRAPRSVRLSCGSSPQPRAADAAATR